MVTKKKLLVAGLGRSGTSWLVDMLNSHSMISCRQELFQGFARPQQATREELCNEGEPQLPPHGDAESTSTAVKYLEEKVWTLPTPVAGLKLMPYHRLVPSLLEYIWARREDFHCIWLRRNPIRTLLSKYHARKLQQYHAIRLSRVRKRPVVSLDPADFLKRLGILERFEEFIPRLLSNIHTVYYADLCTATEKATGETLKWLGLPLEPLSSDHIRLQPGGFRDLVSNWREVAAALRPDQQRRYFAPNDPML